MSPNRSILDEDGDEDGDDDSSASSNKEEFLETESGTDISFLDISDAKDISVSRDLSTSQALSSVVESKREIVLMKAELAQANKKIKSMEDDMEKLQRQHLSGENTSSIEQVEVVAETRGLFLVCSQSLLLSWPSSPLVLTPWYTLHTFIL